MSVIALLVLGLVRVPYCIVDRVVESLKAIAVVRHDLISTY
jgi:hypothetical protein